MNRITFDPAILGGRATIRGFRISVSHLVNLVANGMSVNQILSDYPQLEADDIRAALRYAARLADDQIHALPALDA